MSFVLKLSATVIVFLGLSAGEASFAGIQSYRAPQIAPTIEQCQAYEPAVVENFKILTKAKVLSHSCEVNPGRTTDLVIEYAHPSALKLVSTYSEFSHVTGLYDDQQDCLANRDADVTRYREETGLEPVVAYCFNDYFQDMKGASWTLRIDSFGDAKRFPFTFSRHLFNGNNADPADTESQITSALSTFGATGIKVRFSKFRDASDLMILYYAPKEAPFVEYYQGNFTSNEHCEYYRETMREIFARAGGQTATFFCVANAYSSGARIFTLGTITEPLASELTSTSYPSYQDCEAKRAETEASWRDGLEREIVGSICAREGLFAFEGVRMRMFWTE